MENMICFDCVLKHIAGALSYGKEIISGHTIGAELDHRIDFLGQIKNAEDHLQLMDKSLWEQISDYRKQLQSRKVLVETKDLTFLRNIYNKVQMLQDGNTDTDIIYEQMTVEPIIVYDYITNIDYFKLSLNSVKTHLKDYSKIVVLSSDFDLSEYSVEVLNLSLSEYCKQSTDDFILMYENTAILKEFSAKKIANSFSMKRADNFDVIGYLRKSGIQRSIYNYDGLKPCRINPNVFNEYITDYSGKFPITVYCYLGNQTTKLNDTQTTVYIDRNICCSVKSELKRKMFARWNEKGFESLKNFLNLD